MALALVSVVVFDLIGPAVSLTLVAIGCLIYCITFWVALPNPRQSRRAQETSVKRTANAPWAKRIEKREYRGGGCVVAALVGIVLLRLLGLFGFSLPTSEPMRTVVVAIAGGGVLLLAFAYTRWRTKRAALATFEVSNKYSARSEFPLFGHNCRQSCKAQHPSQWALPELSPRWSRMAELGHRRRFLRCA